MNRYFLEVAYKGTNYAGSQVQANANSVQAELEKAMEVYFRRPVTLTGSSRTDTGVHALQNYFHADLAEKISAGIIYNINALLPADIVVRNIIPVPAAAHCRFDARAREYEYKISPAKNPFLQDRAYFFPYALDFTLLQAVADILKDCQDFTSFAKRNSQVKTFECRIEESSWIKQPDQWVYRVRANRFLRGMVKGMVGTMLKAGLGKITPGEFREIIAAKDCKRADFSVPGHGLFLVKVEYPAGYFNI